MLGACGADIVGVDAARVGGVVEVEPDEAVLRRVRLAHLPCFVSPAALALGIALYPVAYAGGAAALRRARRGSTPLPTGRDVSKAAKHAARKELKRQRRKARR